MFPDPAQQAGQRAFNDSVRRQANDHLDAMRRSRGRNGGRAGSGIGGLLKLVLLVVVVAVLVQNPELRADLWAFALNVRADLQGFWTDVQNR